MQVFFSRWTKAGHTFFLLLLSASEVVQILISISYFNLTFVELCEGVLLTIFSNQIIHLKWSRIYIYTQISPVHFHLNWAGQTEQAPVARSCDKFGRRFIVMLIRPHSLFRIRSRNSLLVILSSLALWGTKHTVSTSIFRQHRGCNWKKNEEKWTSRDSEERMTFKPFMQMLHICGVQGLDPVHIHRLPSNYYHSIPTSLDQCMLWYKNSPCGGVGQLCDSLVHAMLQLDNIPTPAYERKISHDKSQDDIWSR